MDYKLHDIGLGKDFLDMIPKAQVAKAKEKKKKKDKWNILKNFCPLGQ